MVVGRNAKPCSAPLLASARTLLHSFFNEAVQLRVGQALAKNTHLVELLMANSVIKEAGAVAIGKGLEANTTVTIVNLESNRCGTRSAGPWAARSAPRQLGATAVVVCVRRGQRSDRTSLSTSAH